MPKINNAKKYSAKTYQCQKLANGGNAGYKINVYCVNVYVRAGFGCQIFYAGRCVHKRPGHKIQFVFCIRCVYWAVSIANQRKPSCVGAENMDTKIDAYFVYGLCKGQFQVPN